MSTSSFDDLIDDAWSEFSATLLPQLGDLEPGQFVEIARQDGLTYRPLIVITITGSGRIRCTISGSALPIGGRREWIAIRRDLADLGWRYLPRKDQHIAESGKRSLATLSTLACRTLRELWGFAHPSFVTIHNPFRRVPDLPRPGTIPGRRLSAVPDPASPKSPPLSDAPGIIVPTDDDHLLHLARDLVADDLRQHLTIQDGWIEVMPSDLDSPPWGIFATPHGPSLEFVTTLTHRLTDPGLLGGLIVEHSAAWPEIAFTVSDDHVYARRIFDGAVFHPDNLALALCTWLRFLREAAFDIVDALNAGGPGAHTCAHSTIPVGLQTLFEIDTSTGLTPERIVHLTNAKIDRLVEYLDVCRALAQEAARSSTTHHPVVAFYEHFVGLLESAVRQVESKGA